MIELFVGPRKELIRVHKNILYKVPYFKKMFTSPFKSDPENAATFPEDSPESFDVLLEWIYLGTIKQLKFIRTLHDENGGYINYDVMRAYALAQKLCLTELMDRLLDAYKNFYKTVNKVPGPAEIRIAYNLTSKKSPLRRFVVQAWHWVLVNFSGVEEDPSRNVFTRQFMKENDDFAADFLAILRETNGVRMTDPRILPDCDFHHHGKDKKCPYLLEDTE